MLVQPDEWAWGYGQSYETQGLRCGVEQPDELSTADTM